MSSKNTQSSEELVRKVLKQMERKGKNIQAFLWLLMEEFENEDFDEKNQEINNNNTNQITLLHDEGAANVCQVGHEITATQHEHLRNSACIICGHKNNNNIQNKTMPNHQQILTFLSQYNTQPMPFGPHQNQKGEIKSMMAWDYKWPLHCAAMAGDTKKINELCKYKNINVDQKMTDWDDAIPILCASRYGQLEAVLELIKNGANAMPTPNKTNQTPYQVAAHFSHKAIIVFFQSYVKYVYNFDINSQTNLQCYYCFNYDLNFNKQRLNGTMANYVYCVVCAVENVEKVKKKQEINGIIERRIIKTLKENPSISVDTLCQMKDVKALHTILREIIVSGQAPAYTLWLLDIDNFKAINTYLGHAKADTKIQALGKVLKKLETVTEQQWRESGYDGLWKVWAFRQGGDEFAMVVKGHNYKLHSQQKLYWRLKKDVNQIQLGQTVKVKNGNTMQHITVSIGACGGQDIGKVEEWMTKADEAAETVKQRDKDNIAIYDPLTRKIYQNFKDIP